MNKEYEKLILQFEAAGYKLSEDMAKVIYEMQKRNQEDILNQIAKILLSYTIKDSELSISDNDRKKLQQDFNEKITAVMNCQLTSENEVIASILKKVVEQKYYTSAYAMSLGINYKLKKVSNGDIDKIVNSKLQGEAWGERLWENKKAMASELQQQAADFLKGKVNVNQIEDAIKNKFNQNAYNSHRLVQTEVARCQTAANDLFAEKHSVKQQMFCATLDSRTSETCRGYDGKVFDIDDSNKPTPPLHPFCRSCLINIPYDDWKPKMRVDNETKEKIPYMTYDEWYEKIVKAKVQNAYNELIGLKVKTGLDINSVSEHLTERAIQRKVSAIEARDALINPLKIGKIVSKENGNSQEFVGEFARVIINPDTGNIITIWKTSSKLRTKLKGGK
ncbi:MAG: minor capsid protein [Solirubrobacterales bacterium]